MSRVCKPVVFKPCMLGTLGKPANWSTGSAGFFASTTCPTRLYPPFNLLLEVLEAAFGAACWAPAPLALAAGAGLAVLLSGGHDDALLLECRR
jgi:hypothetical protein